MSPLAVPWVGLWSVIVAFPQFPGLTSTVLLFCAISDGYTNECILLTEHFQRLGCVRNNQNKIGCDAYS